MQVGVVGRRTEELKLKLKALADLLQLPEFMIELVFSVQVYVVM